MAQQKFTVINGNHHEGFAEILNKIDCMIRDGSLNGLAVAIVDNNGKVYSRSCTQNASGMFSLLGAVNMVRFDIEKWINDPENYDDGR